MEAVVTTAAIRRTKLQVVTTNNLLTGLMPFVAQTTMSKQ